jgi:hypothetical protein
VSSRKRRTYTPDIPFDDLTPLQQKLVLWMHQNGGSPWDAVRAGVCSKASVELWRVTNIEGWVKGYIDSLPPTPLDLSNHVQAQLNGLMNQSVRVIRDTLVAGEGNATAVKTAQWVLDKIQSHAAERGETVGADVQEAEAELAAVLRLVQQ